MGTRQGQGLPALGSLGEVQARCSAALALVPSGLQGLGGAQASLREGRRRKWTQATLGDFPEAGSSSDLQMKRGAQGEGRFLRESGLGVGAGRQPAEGKAVPTR